MKKSIILFFFMSLSSVLLSQPEFSAPLGLSFGSSLEEVKVILDSKGGEFDEISNQQYGKSLSYFNIPIGSLIADLGVFKFVNDKFFYVDLTFNVSNSNQIQEKYDKICDIIASKYGKGNSFRDFKYPYSDGDDDMVIAMERGYADIATYWTDLDNGAIVVKIRPVSGGLYVLLCYQQVELLREAQAKINSLNNSEF